MTSMRLRLLIGIAQGLDALGCPILGMWWWRRAWLCQHKINYPNL